MVDNIDLVSSESDTGKKVFWTYLSPDILKDGVSIIIFDQAVRRSVLYQRL